jgi:putative inorganic carbon (HCO3(-)) transporter
VITLPSRRVWLAAGASLAAGLALALPDLTTAGLFTTGTVLVIAALLRPELCLYLLALAVPFGEIRQLSVGGLAISGAEAVVALLIVTWLARGVARRRLELHPGPLLWPLSLLLAALLLSLFDTIAYAPSAKELAKWLEVMAVYLAATSLLREPGRRSGLVVALLAAGTLEAGVAIYGSLMRLGPPSYAILGGLLYRASGDFAQPNPFAGYMNHVWPLALALLLVPRLSGSKPASGSASSPGVRRSALLLAVVGITLGGLLLSWSRGAWLGAAAALVVMAIAFTASLLASSTATERAAGRRALRVLLLGGVMLASVGLLGAADLLPSAITVRLGSMASDLQVLKDIRTVKVTDENFATVERVAHWWSGWRMWEDHPWTGVGIGNYATAYPAYNLAGWEDPLGHAHNFYINMGAEAGTLGLSAYLIFLFAALWQAGRCLFGATNTWQRALALGILGILVARIIQDGLDSLWVHAMGIQMALLLGLLSARERT